MLNVLTARTLLEAIPDQQLSLFVYFALSVEVHKKLYIGSSGRLHKLSARASQIAGTGHEAPFAKNV